MVVTDPSSLLTVVSPTGHYCPCLLTPPWTVPLNAVFEDVMQISFSRDTVVVVIEPSSFACSV